MGGLRPDICGGLYQAIAFLLLYIHWVRVGDSALFFLLLFLVAMVLTRQRFPRCWPTLLIDQAVCIAAVVWTGQGEYALVVVLFELCSRGRFLWALPTLVYLLVFPSPLLALLLAQSGVAGFFLRRWANTRARANAQKDEVTRHLYELESLQRELMTSGAQIARMTETAERARIAREIHDRAGHEIVAAYISLQASRPLMDDADPEALSLLDDGLGRLESGLSKIRETVHNLAPVTVPGIDTIRSLCHKFTYCPVECTVYGDTGRIPAFLWGILESCVHEALTNVMRHSQASAVSVTLDVAGHIVRLCVQNDGVQDVVRRGLGLGLRNLRHRIAAVGGSLSAESKRGFRLICVLPLGNEAGV